VIEFVESDGNGRTKGYLPEDPAAARVTSMSIGSK
jgi:hypothetical protein